MKTTKDITLILVLSMIFIFVIGNRLWADEYYHYSFSSIIANELRIPFREQIPFNFTYPFGFHLFLSLFAFLPITIARIIISGAMTLGSYVILNKLYKSKRLSIFLVSIPLFLFYNSFMLIESLFFFTFFLTLYFVKKDSWLWLPSFLFLFSLKFFLPLIITPILLLKFYRKNNVADFMIVAVASMIFLYISFYYSLLAPNQAMGMDANNALGMAWIETLDVKTFFRWLMPYTALGVIKAWSILKDRKVFDYLFKVSIPTMFIYIFVAMLLPDFEAAIFRINLFAFYLTLYFLTMISLSVYQQNRRVMV